MRFLRQTRRCSGNNSRLRRRSRHGSSSPRIDRCSPRDLLLRRHWRWAQLVCSLASSPWRKSANAGVMTRARWRINDAGGLERSFGQGPWEPVAVDGKSKMHVVAAINDAVWVGGDSDALYRSHDVGLTWQPVPLPEKNGADHVIAHIRFENPTNGAVEAADGTMWTTTDGGTTWK